VKIFVYLPDSHGFTIFATDLRAWSSRRLSNNSAHFWLITKSWHNIRPTFYRQADGFPNEEEVPPNFSQVTLARAVMFES
jgi:hypothetical protein